MIRFQDLIKPLDIKKTKVKFNMNPSNQNKRAWDLLLDDSPEWLGMNEHRRKHANNNLDRANYLIALAQYYPYGVEYFVFGGIYKVEKIIPEILDGRGYHLTLMPEYQEYIKRLIIKINKPIGRDLYNRWYENLDDLKPEIYELAPTTKLGHFPGYQNVLLKHRELQYIINRDEPSWKQALSNVKGIYVIIDTNTGKLYIGSASGNTEGIWQRWSAYADINNLTGGNKEFKVIIEREKEEYIINNFKYSILEIFDVKTKQQTIIEREEYWKKVFETKKFGMNH